MNWWEHAACKGRTELGWYADNHNYDLSLKRQALDLCATCRVRAACLEDALQDGDAQFGIRGGHTALERLAMPRPRRLPPPPRCGTDAGYYRHLRTLKESPCQPCRDAHRERAMRSA